MQLEFLIFWLIDILYAHYARILKTINKITIKYKVSPMGGCFSYNVRVTSTLDHVLIVILNKLSY